MEDILEFKYLNGFSVILFKCKWFNTDPTKKKIKTDNNITSINISSEWFKDDQFILASQAKQVFYVNDLFNSTNWKVVVDVNHPLLKNCVLKAVWNCRENDILTIVPNRH